MGNTSSHHSSAASTPAQQPAATSNASSSHAPSSSTSIPTPTSTSRPIPQTRTSQPSPSTPPGLISGGHLHPQNPHALGPGHTQDYNDYIVTGLILRQQLAPFYRGLEDFEEDWDDARIAEELKQLRLNHPTPPRVDPAESTPTGAASGSATGGGSGSLLGKRILGRGSISSLTSRGRASSISNVMANANNSSTSLVSDEDRSKREAEAYRGAVECPICFLYYPPNINTSRCCQQPVCTECFVQMKRSEATVTHLESEVVSCPFCVEPDFGVIYEMKKAIAPKPTPAFPGSQESEIGIDPRAGRVETTRRKSVSHTAKEVVTIDQIRPDWEEKLNGVKAAAARRASRRIVMRQVGDRMIPIGFTSSRGANGETGPVGEEELATLRGGAGSRRRRGESDGVTGADLEEIMLMEAMRLSMVTHEEEERRQAEETRKKEQEQAEAARRAMWAGATSGPSQPSAAMVSTSTSTGSKPPPSASSATRPSASRMLSTISSVNGAEHEHSTIEGEMSEAISAPLERRS